MATYSNAAGITLLTLPKEAHGRALLRHADHRPAPDNDTRPTAPSFAVTGRTINTFGRAPPVPLHHRPHQRRNQLVLAFVRLINQLQPCRQLPGGTLTAALNRRPTLYINDYSSGHHTFNTPIVNATARAVADAGSAAAMLR